MTDRLLALWMSRVIERCRQECVSAPIPSRRKIDKLRLLFVGYNGTRNTGSDVRVEEMLRQVRHLFGADRVDFTVCSYDQKNTLGYFPGVRQITPPVLFPAFLGSEIPRYHGVVACEGSTFKSKFTDLLTVLMTGAIGVASAWERLAIAYGAEAGEMSPLARQMTSRYCRDALILTRNEQSRQILDELSVASELGTDTAWTFRPLDRDYGEKELKRVGWQGEPVLIVCPINPFWWPVKASVSKSFARMFGAYRDSHYARIFFFQSGPEIQRRFSNYILSLARAVDRFRKKTPVFPVLVASEQLDNPAISALAEKLGGVPAFSSTDFNMYQLVSILRCADLMVSSRYHAIVTTMPAGVPSIGVSMDERIANLMHDRGHEDLLIQVDDPHLTDNLLAAMGSLWENRDSVAEQTRRSVVKQLRLMSDMGRQVERYVCHRFPELEPSFDRSSWLDFLPTLDGQLDALVAEYACS